jgi:hypothetical protein
VPNGVVAVSSNGPNGMFNAGGSPQGEYDGAISYPGGRPGSGPLNVDQAVIAAANALAAAAGYGNNVNYFLYGRQDEARPRNWSLQFFGNCAGYIADSGANCTGDYNMGRGINFYALPTIPTYTTSNPTVAGSAPKIFGAQVAIKATTININASIEAGRVTNRSVTITQDIANSLEGSRNAYLNAGYSTVKMTDLFPDDPAWKAATTVQLSYDFVNRRFVMDDVNASSGGGSVLLDGKIISTNTLGSIKINGGYGDVNVINNSGRDLIVNRVNTGTGVGVAASVSKITIIDRLITSGPNTTVYAYTPGSGIAEYKTHNGAQPILSGPGATTPVRFVAGDTTRHETVAGTRYEWTQQALLQKVGLTVDNRNQANIPGVYWRFDSGTSSNPWVYVDAQSPSTNPGADPRFWWSRNEQAPSAELVSGRVVTGKTNLTHVGMTQEITGGQLDFIHNSASYGGCNGQAINHCDYDFVAQPGATQAVWDYNYATRAFVQITTSVKADNPFAISFAGNAAGRVNITSNSSILQNGTIVNPSGTTTITASGGSFTQANSATILSNNLNLTARDSIGTQATAIKATLTQGAQLNATAGSGGINLDITGSARVAALRADQTPGAYGNINVRATGSLEAVATGSTNIVGRNITLVSDEGAIGSLSNLMTMRAVATQLPNGSQVDGVVNLTARGDIGIAQVAGDLRVGQIESKTGDVRIDVNAGRLVSATGQTAAQALSAEQLSKVSRALKLTAAEGADAAAVASITTFEKQVTQSYAQYSALIRNGSVELVDTDGDGVKERVFKLDTAAIALYQAFADQELKSMAAPGAVVPAATTDQVKAYAARRYAAYSSVFESAYGSGWTEQARFRPATLESNYSFSVNGAGVAPGLANRIAGDAVWTERQLVSAINTSALQPDPGVVGNGRALVIGHDVTLNTAGSIGSLAPDVQVALADIRSGAVTNAQLAALAVATTPGTVKLIGRRSDGSLVDVADLNNVPNGVTLTRVDVKQTAPLFINATGTFSASAQGDVYVQATGAPNSAGGTLTVGRITATGTVSLQAPQGIVVGTQGDGTTPRNPVQIQTNGDLILVAGGGGIGSAATALTYQIGGRLVSASAAAGDAYLVANAGNAEIGRIFASGTASLTARAGGIQGYLPGVAISAESIRLSATGNVGSASAALGLRVGSGEISGSVGGSAWLSGPTVAGQTPTTFRIGELSATNGLDIVADGEIDIQRAVRSSAGAASLLGARITMASGAEISAAGRVSLASDSAIVLGRVASTLAAPAGGASIALTAIGAITGNGDSGALLDASQPGGVISLYAGAGIGTDSAALAFAAPTISARSLLGNVNLSTGGATHVTSLTADAGALALSAGGNLVLDTVTSSSGAQLSTSNGSLTLGTLSAGGSSALAASGAVSIGSAATTAGDLSITSTGASINAASVSAAEDATLSAATSIAVTNALTAGGAASLTASAGTLDLGSLSAGASSALTASGAITLGSVETSVGDLSVSSTGAGISAAGVDAAGDATLTAATSIAVTSGLTAGGAANVAANGGTLGLGSLSAGANSSLTASGPITLGSATTTAGDLSVTSTGASITATSVDAAGNATLTAATSIAVTNALVAGGAANLTASSGPLGLGSLNAGANSSLIASGAVTLGSATTTAGDLSVTSTGAHITATSVDAAGNATLTAATSIAVTNALVAGGAANLTASSGTLGLGGLNAGANSSLIASGAVTLGSAETTVGNLSISSTGAGISATSIDAAGDATLAAATSIAVTNGLTAGGAATLTASNGTLDLGSLSAGATSSLTASDAVTLGSAATTAGALAITSTAAGITATSIDAAGSATLTAATAIAVTNGLTAGGTANVTASGGTLAIDMLSAGATSSLSGSGRVTLGSAATSAGDLSIRSTGADIIAATINGAGDVILAAATSLSVTNGLTAGGGASLSASGGTLAVDHLSAGAASTLTASGAITLTTATTTAGNLSINSTGAGITAASIDAAGSAALTAASSIAVTNGLTAGGIASLAANGGSLTIDALTSASAVLSASDAISLDSARTMAGDFSARSIRAGITALTIDAAGAATLQGATDLSITRLASGASAQLVAGGRVALGSLDAAHDLSVTAGGRIVLGDAQARWGAISLVSRNGTIQADALAAAGSITGSAAGDLSFGMVRSGADVLLASSAGLLRAGTLTSGRDVGLQARSIVFDLVDAGRSASLIAQADITGSRIVASDALTLLAGRSGQGSIAIDIGAARSTNANAADTVRLGRFGAGDSITILGTRIAADIVQLPGGAGLPLMLDIGGSRERTAESVDLRIDTERFQIGRFESVDGVLTTTSNEFSIAEAFVPGALRVTTPIMTILANNRSLAPVPGFDVQLYPRDRGFSLTVNGNRLATSAFIVGVDTDVVDAPEGMHIGRDLARLGALLSNGASFGAIARGFVLGTDGRWRSSSETDEPATTAGIGVRPKPLVNLVGFEEQP